MRQGEFDPPEMVPYNKVNMSEVQSAQHQELAIIAAMKTFVLLKNNGTHLPLKGKVGKLAVSTEIFLSLDARTGSGSRQKT